MNFDKLKAMLTRNEARRNKIYKCSQGKWSGGIGRNLEDVGFSEDEIDLMFSNDVAKVSSLLDRYLPWWRGLNEARQLALFDMAFNLGVGPSQEDPTGSLLTFKNTLKAIEEERWADAAQGIRSSLYAKQVGNRAERNALAIEVGES